MHNEPEQPWIHADVYAAQLRSATAGAVRELAAQRRAAPPPADPSTPVKVTRTNTGFRIEANPGR